MSLHEAQCLHLKLAVALLTWALGEGYEIAWGETLRSQATANANAASGAGIRHSLHLIGLAIDLKLFKAGLYLTDSEDYAPLGTYWKGLHPLCRWGGDFKDAQGNPKPDGDHFSIEWQGVK